MKVSGLWWTTITGLQINLCAQFYCAPSHAQNHRTAADLRPFPNHNQSASSPIPISPAIGLTALTAPSTSHAPSVAVAPPAQSRFRNSRSSAVCSLFHFFSDSHTALDSVNLSALPRPISVSRWFPKTQKLFYWFGVRDLIRRTTNKRKRIRASDLIFLTLFFSRFVIISSLNPYFHFRFLIFMTIWL